MDEKQRCKWCNMKNPTYIAYHDEEWCRPNFDNRYLYEMLILESFQAGLSWECVLNKREAFRKAYDGFDPEKVCAYDDTKKQELLENKEIIRNRLKINASIGTAGFLSRLLRSMGRFISIYADLPKTLLFMKQRRQQMRCRMPYRQICRSVE